MAVPGGEKAIGMSGNGSRNDGGIIQLEDVRRDAGAREIRTIEDYWSAVKGNRLVPTRSDIDPKGLQGVLTHAFIVERIATGLARFRIAGSHLSELMGIEVRGIPLSSIFAPEARLPLSESVEAVFDDPSAVRLRLGAEAGFGRPEMTGEMVLLPLRSDLGEISRALGGLVMVGAVGRAPRRLLITGQTRRGLTGLAGPETDHRFESVDGNTAEDRPGGRPIMSEREAPSRDHVTRKRAHLRLVSDNAALK